MKVYEIRTGYVRELADWLQEIETRLNDLYGLNWTFRIERERPGVWRCWWGSTNDRGEVIGGGSESFTVNL